MKGHIFIYFLFLSCNQVCALHVLMSHPDQNPAELPTTLWGHQLAKPRSTEQLAQINAYINMHQQELLPAVVNSCDQEIPCTRQLSDFERWLLPFIQQEPNSNNTTLWNKLAKHPVILGICTGNLSQEDLKLLAAQKVIDCKHDHKHKDSSNTKQRIELIGPLPSLVLLKNEHKNFLAQYTSLKQLEFMTDLYTRRLKSLQTGGNGTIYLNTQDQELFNSLDLVIRNNLKTNYVLKLPRTLQRIAHCVNPMILLPCLAIAYCYYYISAIPYS